MNHAQKHELCSALQPGSVAALEESVNARIHALTMGSRIYTVDAKEPKLDAFMAVCKAGVKVIELAENEGSRHESLQLKELRAHYNEALEEFCVEYIYSKMVVVLASYLDTHRPAPCATTSLTPSEQHSILAATNPKQLFDVTANIDYLVAMVQEWLCGRVWSTRDCPPRFSDVCKLVLGDDPSIPKALYSCGEAALVALAKLKKEDEVRYYRDAECAAARWLWDELQGKMQADTLALPADLLSTV